MAPLAIIGFAARYAQEAYDAEKFWDFLLNARQSTTAFPEDRFNADAFYHPDPEHGGTVRLVPKDLVMMGHRLHADTLYAVQCQGWPLPIGDSSGLRCGILQHK